MVFYFFSPDQLIQLSKEIQAHLSLPSSAFFRGEKSDLLVSVVSDDSMENAFSCFSFVHFCLLCVSATASVTASAFVNNLFEHFLWFDRFA